MSNQKQFTITRLRVRNFRSIQSCDVKLPALSFLVGPNGSGKSNLLSALKFVSDAIQIGIAEAAIHEGGGLSSLVFHGSDSFSIRIDFRLGEKVGFYAFKATISSKDLRPTVDREWLEIRNDSLSKTPEVYLYRRIDKRTDTTWVDSSYFEDSREFPFREPERLYLKQLEQYPEIEEVIEAFKDFRIFSPEPQKISAIQSIGNTHTLKSDCSNAVSIFDQLSSEAKNELLSFLTTINPQIKKINRYTGGGKEWLTFQQVESQGKSFELAAEAMSVGTLRAFGVLLALYQINGQSLISPIAIEEPEIGVHPVAFIQLRSAIRLAATKRQIIVTSHSPELLNDSLITPGQILAVSSELGSTVVQGLDEASASLIQDKLFTAGELLSNGQLTGLPLDLIPPLPVVNPHDLFPSSCSWKQSPSQ